MARNCVKMLTTTGCQENASQNHETHLRLPGRLAIRKRKTPVLRMGGKLCFW